MKNVLLVSLQDGRRFFTDESNLPLLTDFSNAFKASLSLVVDSGQPKLEMEDLVDKINNIDIKSEILDALKKEFIVDNLLEKYPSLTKTKIMSTFYRIKKEFKEKGITIKRKSSGIYEI